jgi:hypothetical protein
MATSIPSRRIRRRPSPRAIEIFRRHQILGESLRAIAKAMDCSAPRVHQVCRYVSRWLAEQPAEPNIPVIRQRHQETLRWLVSEAFAAWERSKQTARTTKARTVRGRANQAGEPLPDLVTSEYIDRPQCGDPRYLTIINDLLKSERAMWGADEPKRHEHSGADGGPITLANVLTIIEQRPPSPPAFLDPNPPNVINVESCARLIDDPNFMPDTLADGVPAQGVLPDESSETAEEASEPAVSAETTEPGPETPADSEPAEFVFRAPGEFR